MLEGFVVDTEVERPVTDAVYVHGVKTNIYIYIYILYIYIYIYFSHEIKFSLVIYVFSFKPIIAGIIN